MKLDNSKHEHQRLHISLNDLPPLATLALFFLSCSAGTVLKDIVDDESKALVYTNLQTGDGSAVQASPGDATTGFPRKLLYRLPLRQKASSMLSNSSSVVICRLFKNENNEWEVMAVGHVCD
jgi:hypothetical protein